MTDWFTKYYRSRNGNIAIFFALIAPVLLAFVGAGVDYARYASAREALQSFADKGALAGARQFTLTRRDANLPETIAKQTVDAALIATEYAKSAITRAKSNQVEFGVSVNIQYTFEPTFLVSIFKNPLTLSVESTAQALGGANICVVTLSENKKESLSLSGTSKLSGDNCAIYTNSTHNRSLSVIENAQINSEFICTGGGFEGTASSYTPVPITDCPAREDPLAQRVQPSVGSCTSQQSEIHNDTVILNPGVFCDGLSISGNSDVILSPGVYIFADADLIVKDQASVTGLGVGLFFEGEESSLSIAQDTHISLSAPTTGVMAGLLIMQDRNADPQRRYSISSNDARTLIGTIYLPNGDLYIDATSPVAAASAYTAIIVDELELAASVELVLNSDYSATDVPVPAGIGGVQDVYLRN